MKARAVDSPSLSLQCIGLIPELTKLAEDLLDLIVQFANTLNQDRKMVGFVVRLRLSHLVDFCCHLRERVLVWETILLPAELLEGVHNFNCNELRKTSALHIQKTVYKVI